MSRRVLLRVYGDSVSLPRVAVGVDYLQTYAELAAARLRAAGTPCDVYNRSINGIDVASARERFANDSVYFGPGQSIVVIQAGIVDCAPRPIPYWLRDQIGRLPGPLRAPIIRVLHDHRARILTLGHVWRRTTPRVFAREYRAWLEQAARENGHVYTCNILPTHPHIEAHSPGFGESVRQYNALIAAAVRDLAAANVTAIDVHARVLSEADGVAKYVTGDDGHHLTPAGHRLYCDLLTGAGPLSEVVS